MNHDGIGLGLTIVKNIVMQSGGSVAVESEGEGKGRLFCISLKMELAEEKLPEIAEKTRAADPLQQLLDMTQQDKKPTPSASKTACKGDDIVEELIAL